MDPALTRRRRPVHAAAPPARREPYRVVATVAALLLAGCSLFHRPGSPEVGTASWYGAELGGTRTASGRRFDPHALTAAHRTLPLGSYARVTNLANGRSVVVRIDDRGPFARGRVIDLSYAAARALGMVRRGTVRVRVEPLDGRRATAQTGRARVRAERGQR
jgi:rare lipoprotein A